MRANSETRLFELLVETANTYIHLPYAELDAAIEDSMRKLGSFIGADWVRSHHGFTEHEETLLQVFAKMLVNVRKRYDTQREAEQTAQSVEPYLRQAVDLIPPSFLEPSKTRVRLTFDNLSLETPGFRSTDVAHSVEIRVSGDVRGQLLVCLDPDIAFLQEEVALMDGLSHTIGFHIERIHAEVRRKESEARIRSLLQTQTNYVIRTDLQGYHTYWNPHFEKDFGWLYAGKGLREGDSLASICTYHHDRVK